MVCILDDRNSIEITGLWTAGPDEKLSELVFGGRLYTRGVVFACGEVGDMAYSAPTWRRSYQGDLGTQAVRSKRHDNTGMVAVKTIE